jgi:hypothetical protein
MGMTEPHIDRTSSIHYQRRMVSLTLVAVSMTEAYLHGDIIQRVRGVDRKGNEDHMRLGVGEWS